MIAHFVYNLFSYSGAAFQAQALCKYLGVKDNIIFNVGNSTKLRLLSVGGVIVVDLPKNYFKRLIYILVFYFSYRVKITHLHGWILSGLIPAIMLRKKIVLKTTMFGDDDLPSLSQRSWINRILIRYLSSIISISDTIKNANDSYICLNKLKCRSIIIPNGVQEESNLPNLTNKGPIFCTVGVVSERKGTLKAIEYFVKNYICINNSKLYIVGPTPIDSNYFEADVGYYYKCLEYANKYPEKIIFTGKLKREEVVDIYKMSIAHIFFSIKEGMPNVLLESMYYNCVPIVTEIDGVAYDIIDNGKDGFIFENNIFKDISYESVKIISSEYAPRCKVLDKFLLEKLSVKHKENYKNLVMSNEDM
ncbi:hypothetical protein SHEWT2_04105 [Shewanella hafniensis]|nr:hypothetical protein SHEWT2_04105 [Shewanella hafniensis]